MKLHDFEQIMKRDLTIEVPNDLDFVAKVVSMSPMESPVIHRRPLWKFAPVLASLFIVIVTSITLFANQEVVSTISVDINPSIELSLNRHGDVVNIASSESIGESLIQAMDVQKGDLSEVLHSLLDAIVEEGYGTTTATSLLFGVDAKSYEEETLLASQLESWSQEQSVNALTLLSHTDMVTMYSGLVDQTLESDERSALEEFFDGIFATSDTTATTLYTTTAAWDGSFADNPENNPDATDVQVWDSQVMSLEDFQSFADSLGVSDAMLQLILLIVMDHPAYNSYEGFVALSEMSVSELLALYNAN